MLERKTLAEHHQERLRVNMGASLSTSEQFNERYQAADEGARELKKAGHKLKSESNQIAPPLPQHRRGWNGDPYLTPASLFILCSEGWL